MNKPDYITKGDRKGIWAKVYSSRSYESDDLTHSLHIYKGDLEFAFMEEEQEGLTICGDFDYKETKEIDEHGFPKIECRFIHLSPADLKRLLAIIKEWRRDDLFRSGFWEEVM